MSKTKLRSAEIADYYLSVHRKFLSDDPGDEVAPVINPSSGHLMNRFTDFAHRLGMAKAFRYLLALRPLSGLEVLDLGCGRGRWCKEYASQGAHVTGVDISPEAVNWLSKNHPTHRFICSDITQLSFPEQSFDIINCVTVLQHMEEHRQQTTLLSSHRMLKTGGYLVLMENTRDFSLPIVYPHTQAEWVRMAEANGLSLRSAWGANYEILIRALSRLEHKHLNARPAVSGARESRMRSLLKNVIALISFPLEWMCNYLRLGKPSHSVMVFQKQ